MVHPTVKLGGKAIARCNTFFNICREVGHQGSLTGGLISSNPVTAPSTYGIARFLSVKFHEETSFLLATNL